MAKRKTSHYAKAKAKATHAPKAKRVAKGKKPAHARKGHKISPAQRKAMDAGRKRWLATAGGAAYRKHMAALRKAGAIGKGAKGKHSNRGKMAGKFKNEKKAGKVKAKRKSHYARAKAKGRKGGHHARKGE